MITVKIGILAIDEIDSIKMVSAMASNNNYDTFDYPIGTAFQTPADNIYTITKIIYNSSSVRGTVKFGYGDTEVSDSVTPPTNPVLLTEWLTTEIADKLQDADILLRIPAGKYPFILADMADINCQAFGMIALA